MPSLEELTPEQQAQALQLFAFVKNNPDIEKQIRREAKKKNPNMQAPDLELEAALAAQRTEFQEELAKDRKERLEMIQAERRKDAHDRIKEAGLKPEDVEKVMVDENIGNYDTAIKYMTAQAKLAPGTPPSLTPHSMPDVKELWADRNKYAKSQAFAAINEVIAGRKAG